MPCCDEGPVGERGTVCHRVCNSGDGGLPQSRQDCFARERHIGALSEVYPSLPEVANLKEHPRWRTRTSGMRAGSFGENSMRTVDLKKKSIPKVAVLAAGLAATVMVATMSP